MDFVKLQNVILFLAGQLNILREIVHKQTIFKLYCLALALALALAFRPILQHGCLKWKRLT